MKSHLSLSRLFMVLVLTAVATIFSSFDAKAVVPVFEQEQNASTVVNGIMVDDYEGIVIAVSLSEQTFTVRSSSSSTQIFKVDNNTDFEDDVKSLQDLKILVDYGIEVEAEVEYERMNGDYVADEVEFNIETRTLTQPLAWVGFNSNQDWWFSDGFDREVETRRGTTTTLMESSTRVDQNTNRFIRSPWVYLLPGKIEAIIDGELNNEDNTGAFQPNITLIDIFGNRETVNTIKYRDDRRRNLDVEFTITTRGFYRFEIGQNDARWINSKWRIFGFEIKGKVISGDWVDSRYQTKSAKSIEMLNADAAPATEFFVGDEVELVYSTVIETSTDDLEINEAKFDVLYPSKIDISRIELWLNEEQAAYTEDLNTWIATEMGCGCPQELSMNEAGGQQFKNTLTITEAKHKDVVKIKVFGIADEVGQFNVSIQYRGGKGIDRRNINQISSNAIISNASPIIGFSTQNDFDLEGDSEPLSSSGTILPNSTQPVELIYFRAKTEDKTPVLEWATALEINNDYFSVERSQNGRDFIEVGRVQGKGDYSGTSEYSFNDRTARTGTWYYRLVQHDYNGDSKTYDAVRAVVETITEAKIQVLKNPSNSHQIVFNLEGIDNPADYNIAIVDMNGRMVSTQSLRNYYQSSGTITLDGLNLSKGVYILNVYNNSSRLVSKVLVD